MIIAASESDEDESLFVPELEMVVELPTAFDFCSSCVLCLLIIYLFYLFFCKNTLSTLKVDHKSLHKNSIKIAG